MDDRIFSKRTLLWLVVIGMLSFLGAFVASIYQDKLVKLNSYGANSYSESAVGHKAFTKLLQKMNFRTRISREIRSGFNFSDVKLVIEPQSEKALWNTLSGFSGVGSLIVLPKWDVRQDPQNSRWVKEMELRQSGQVQGILDYVGDDLELVRNDVTLTAENFTWDSELFSLDQQLSVLAPQLIAENPDVLRPLVYNDQGILLAEVIQSDFFYDIDRTWVLSDPDILSNHGLDNAGNAAFIVSVMNQLTHGKAGGVIIDETSHGYASEPSLWQKMFEFPFAVVTLLVGISVLFLAWSSFTRFGSPEQSDQEYRTGKEFLIGNTAELLAFGGHGALMLKQYVDRSLQSVAQNLHAPKNVEPYELLQWLDRVGHARGVALSSSEVIKTAEDLYKANTFNVIAAIRAAQNIHRWKQEMLHGTG
ncbi:hypothetical protein [Kiloniella sp. EL199]|uniref:hypothetical protein n=1 Tax=Kiloniella sp. EL199 TaxID=2107581 RepID=UPI000EA11DD9|nr:hypothetical protein [Kiloniella sp. EL199]